MEKDVKGSRKKPTTISLEPHLKREWERISLKESRTMSGQLAFWIQEYTKTHALGK